MLSIFEYSNYLHQIHLQKFGKRLDLNNSGVKEYALKLCDNFQFQPDVT